MPVKIFFSYAHEDEPLLNKLKMHLRPLQREGLIDVWYDRDISAGAEWAREIDKHLSSAQIILLLVSPDFMNSDYCYGVELARAIERDVNDEARVIPIILRSAYWQGLLGKFQALPKDGKPVKSRYWRNMDEAFSDITEGIRKAINTLPKGFKVDERNKILIQPPEIKQNNKSILANVGQDTLTASAEQIKEYLLEFSRDITLRRDDPDEPAKAMPLRSSLEPSLYIAIGKEPGRVYDIKNSLSIGRRLDNDIFLEDPLVSRQHALVYLDTNGTYILKDGGSANSTIVNGKILKKDETHTLSEGDEIQVGDTLLVFRRGQESL